MSTIRRYTDDFKRDAVAYVQDHPNITMQESADSLGMPKETLYGWVKAYRRSLHDGKETDLTGPMTEQEKEIARLKRELRDTQDALAVLKKAISILNK